MSRWSTFAKINPSKWAERTPKVRKTAAMAEKSAMARPHAKLGMLGGEDKGGKEEK